MCWKKANIRVDYLLPEVNSTVYTSSIAGSYAQVVVLGSAMMLADDTNSIVSGNHASMFTDIISQMATFLGFLIIAYFGLNVYNDAQAKKEEEEQTIVVTDFDYEDVVAFSYDYNNETYSFTKSGDVWSYDADAEFDVDESLVDSTLLYTFEVSYTSLEYVEETTEEVESTED